MRILLSLSLVACSADPAPGPNLAVEAAQDFKGACIRPRVTKGVHSALCTFPVDGEKPVTLICRTDGAGPLVCEKPVIVVSAPAPTAAPPVAPTPAPAGNATPKD